MYKIAVHHFGTDVLSTPVPVVMDAYIIVALEGGMYAYILMNRRVCLNYKYGDGGQSLFKQ